MLTPLRYVLAFLAGAAAAGMGGAPVAHDDSGIVVTAADAVVGEIEQTEQIFAYNVVADVAKRSIDAIRFLDAMLVGLLAAQAAVYAIYLDRGPNFGEYIVRGMEAAIAITLVALVPTIFAQEGPDPVLFRDRFSKEPGETRSELIEVFIAIAHRISILRVVKLTLFLLAMALSVGDIVLARTAAPVAIERADTVECWEKGQ